MTSRVDSREAVVERLRLIEDEIRALGVGRLALFGSVARGHATPDSDIDFLVQFLPHMKNHDRFVKLAELLEQALERRVDLVTTEALSPTLGPHILAEAQDVLRAA
jgi:predicted nucleotidyltransferase